MRSPDASSASAGADHQDPLRHWWLDRSVLAKGLIVVAVPLIILIGVTSANLVLQSHERQARSAGLRARAVSDTAEQVLIEALNAETGIRGYAATRDPFFLDPYRVALARMGAGRTSLRDAAATAGFSRQQRAADATTGKVLLHLAQLRSAISGGISAGAVVPLLKRQKVTMDLLRRQVAGLSRGSTALLNGQRNTISRLETATEVLDLAALVLGLLAGLAGIALFTAGISRRIAAAAANADRLGAGQPLEPADRSADDIGRLADAQDRAAAELRSRMDDLHRANRNLETFTYSVAHDLRAPLRTMAGYSDALMEDCADALGEEGRGYAERIQAASGQMAVLIDDLLRLSRLSRAEMHLQTVDLGAEVTRIAAELQREDPDRRVHFAIQRPVRAQADSALVRTVLQNLVGNAWKFTSGRDDASIEFGTTPARETDVCCYVRDNGAGFDAAYAGKLFAPFQRLHTAREYPGTGVGLASVRQIVERHGGHAWAKGAVGEGATFYFTLDAKEDRANRRADGPTDRQENRPTEGPEDRRDYRAADGPKDRREDGPREDAKEVAR